MFNDLTPAQNNRQPIDDIFAETDKPNNNPASNANNIETHRVGLASNPAAPVAGAPLISSDADDQKQKLPLFKISAIIIVAAILILSGYLVYSKFFKAAPAAVVNTPIAAPAKTQNTNVAPVSQTAPAITPASDQNVVSPSSSLETQNQTASTTGLASGASSTPAVDSKLDSDHDGLTDAEEAIYGTNPLVADTDGDGLTDYEEVKIYHTNPLVADTDGDGYPDGVEVKGGFNPNGPGKMPGSIK